MVKQDFEVFTFPKSANKYPGVILTINRSCIQHMVLAIQLFERCIADCEKLYIMHTAVL